MYMEDKTYTHYIEIVDEKEHYFISFKDALNKKIDLEVNSEVYEASKEAQRVEARTARSDRRHVDYFVTTDCGIDTMTFSAPETTERTVLLRACANEIAVQINALPLRQRKRILLSRCKGMKHREIAAIEGCCVSAISESIKTANKKIKERYVKFSEGA